MRSVRSVGMQVGIVGGVLFSLHALIPGSRSYPFIWPVLAGAAAFRLASSGPTTGRVARGMRATLTAGALLAVVAFIGATITFHTSRRGLDHISDTVGRAGLGRVLFYAELGFAIASVFAFLATVIGGVLIIPIKRTRVSSPDAV